MLEKRRYMLKPIPEIFEAAWLLDRAAIAHLNGSRALAEALFAEADMPIIAAWCEMLWGPYSEVHQLQPAVSAFPSLPKNERHGVRLAGPKLEKEIIERDGLHCRFCSIPVIRPAVRKRLNSLYPSVRWGGRNSEQHAAFQAMWLVCDHIVPHSRGGKTDLETLVIACQPCNSARSESLLDEVNLLDPRSFTAAESSWDGLERLMI